MKLEEYIKLTDEEKIEYLLNYWEIDRPFLIGTVETKEERYIGIADVSSLNNEDVTSPFSETEDIWVYCKIESNIDVSIGEKVLFRFDTNKKCEVEKLIQKPIITSEKNIIRLNEITDKTETDIAKIELNLENMRLEQSQMKLRHRKTMAAIKKKDNEYKEIQSRIIEAEDVIKEKDNEFIEIQSRINKADEDLKKKAEELKEKDKIKKRFEDFGFEFEDDETADSVTGVTDIEKENYIDYIQSYLASREEIVL